MPDDETVTISKDEYERLRLLYAACCAQRDSGKGKPHPLREWNRMSAGVRLAVCELAAFYERN